MNENKRQLSINHSDDEQAKHVRKSIDAEKNSITCIENLSNDLILEIFDYFDGFQLYKTFRNLNTRFQNLLMSSSYPLKFISFHSRVVGSSGCCKKFIYPNRHRIISLHLSYWKMAEHWSNRETTERFFKFITIDQSFHRLESLCLSLMTSTDLIPLLKILTSLPRLYLLYLFVEVKSFFADLCDIYSLIFDLPVLKYILLDSTALMPQISLKTNNNNQCSTIQCMIIRHACRLDDLMILLSYTPQLRRLICWRLLDSRKNIEKEISITLPHLRYILIKDSHLNFDEFESFIVNICSQLRMMSIVTNNDSAYLDANRWERVISKHMPYLEKFDFAHHQFFNDQFRIAEYHQLIHRFTSVFWIKRQWIFTLRITRNRDDENEIIYSIRPKKREWYDLPENPVFNQSQGIICRSEPGADASSVEPYLSTELILKRFKLEDIIPLFTIIRITILNFVHYEISATTLIDCINHLPNLDTLSVNSISLEDSLLKERNTSTSPANKNKITKVNLRYADQLGDIQFFLDLCPVLKYLMIKNWSKIDHQLFVRSILTYSISNTPYLHTMGLGIEENIDKTIEELQNMINLENLTNEYTIKYIDDKIYIQWT